MIFLSVGSEFSIGSDDHRPCVRRAPKNVQQRRERSRTIAVAARQRCKLFPRARLPGRIVLVCKWSICRAQSSTCKMVCCISWKLQSPHCPCSAVQILWVCAFEECCSLVQRGDQSAATNLLAPQAQFRPRAFEKCSALSEPSVTLQTCIVAHLNVVFWRRGFYRHTCQLISTG